MLEKIHVSGFIYNDLKLENILLGYGQKLPVDCTSGNCFQNVILTLVDFGFASRYINKQTGEHEPVSKVSCFRGNLLFSSKYKMQFDRTSRRDDIISLFYLMVYLLNQGNMPGINWR